jgi:hypothetical protein
LDHQVIEADTRKGVEIERREFEKQYGNDTFSEDEIKDICIKYNLRFLRSKHFNGKIDGEVASKLARFNKEHGQEMGGEGEYFIMAPAKAFALYNRPVKPPRDIDPILLYKVPKSDNYVFIHKWGKDFSFLRRLQGLYYENLFTIWFVPICIYYIMFCMIVGYFSESTVTFGAMIASLLFLIPSALLAGLTGLIIFRDGEDWDDRVSSIMWNKNESRI